MERSFDYVVIGGGAAGCPLAAGLAQKGPTLLLERGPEHVKNSRIRTCCNKDEVTWHRTEGGSWTATANVLGGGSAINAGVFLKERADSPFFTEAHPFLNKTRVQEAYEQVTKTVAHKRLNKARVVHDLTSAMQDVGLGKEVVNTNVGQYGIFHPYSLFDKIGVRHSAADFLPGPEDDATQNLVVCTNVRVIRLIFDTSKNNTQVIGFEYQDVVRSACTTRTFLSPNAHYFLSCGAIHTPHLLMLSGVGNTDELSKHRIPLVLDQSHVGQHLKDKAVVAISVSSAVPVSETVLDTMGATPDFTIGTASGGSLASYIGPAILAVIPKMYRTSSVRQAATRMMNLVPSFLLKKLNQQVMIYVTLSNPVSEGSITISSSEPHVQPVIKSAGYQAPEEVQAAAKGLEIVSNLIHSSTFSRYTRNVAGTISSTYGIAEQLLPSALLPYLFQTTKTSKQSPPSPLTLPVLPKTDCRSSDDMKNLKLWLNDMHAEGWTYTGTCRFDDVVNHDFTVKGIEKLSIVDASVLKRPTRVNGQATMMMIGEYAARLVVDRS